MLFTDLVKITKNATNNVFNSPTNEDADYQITKAYVEDNSKVRYGGDGTPFTPKFLILIPGSFEIFPEDTIEIVKMHGKEPIGLEVGKKQILQIRRVGGFSVSHLEVYV